jgi:PLP dependent protein
VSELQENLARIRSRIDQACERSGRQPDSVRLMAVSKNHPPERVAEATSAGLTLFGENRIQEAKVKIPLCPGRLEWHFIGHLQSNKARDAVSLFQVVQGVDSLALAEELQKQASKQARSLPILLEVNVAGESSKFGWKPDRLLAELQQLNALPRLEVHGLMTVAPYAVDTEQVRPVFRRLRELRDRCADLLGAPLPVLSMGMSGDLEVAIEEGSTLVRVGTALFGERPRRTDADSPSGSSDSVS